MINYKKIKSQIKKQNKMFEIQYSEVIKSLESDFDIAVLDSISNKYLPNSSNMEVRFSVNALLDSYQDPEPNLDFGKQSRQSNYIYGILDIMKNRLVKKCYKIEQCSVGYDFIVIKIGLNF